MNANDFEIELKKLDKRFSIEENPNRPGLSNIFYDGKNYDLPAISTNDIRDEIDPAYQYEFPNGFRARFWSKGEVLSRIEVFLKNMHEYKDLYKEKGNE
jgi:hypothetical protein